MKKWSPQELETISCDFCNSTAASSEYVRRDSMRVVECAVCGLAYLNPRPRPRYIQCFYEEDYFTGAAAARDEGGLKLDIDFSRNVRKENRATPRPIELFHDTFGTLKQKDVLEIGCATGDLLGAVHEAGANVKGLELSGFAARIARKRGLDVECGGIEDYVHDHRNNFDIVMAFEVIEHVLSPSLFLEHASELLRSAGLLLISTPNYACAYRFGKDWFGFNTSFEHIYFFSIDILKRMASRSGFTLKYWETSVRSGGPGAPRDFMNRQRERLYNISLSIKENGFVKTLRRKLTKMQNYLPYGSGHTLLAVFEKQPRESCKNEG